MLQASDPNDIQGPDGFGPQNFLQPNQPLPYTIHFENLAAATAPALEVFVTHPLDDDLDLDTFEFGNFGWGTFTQEVPEGLQALHYVVDFTNPDGSPLTVTVDARLDKATRVVDWSFVSTDPATGDFPEDPLAGFLPPNDMTHRGEGFVDYVVRPKIGLPTGTAIRGIADIIFDFNAVIATNQVDPLDASKGTDPNKEGLVTLDAGAPISQVTALPETSGATFLVHWSGQDDAGGSGIAVFDVFVSDDGAPFQPFVTATAETSATFNGEIGHTYRFFAVATDNVGHREDDPGLSEASTTTLENGPAVTLSLSPSTLAEAAGTATVTATLSAVTDIDVTVNLGFQGSATNVADYTRSNSQIVIAAGSISGSITLTAVQDTLGETDETIVVEILDVTNGTESGTQEVTSTIISDDIEINVAVSPLSVTENGTPDLIYTFTRTGITTGATTVNFRVGGTARLCSDYAQSGARSFSRRAGRIAFAAGETTKTIVINPRGDTRIEADETVILTVNPSARYSVGASNSATGTIANDDLPKVSLAVRPASVIEDRTTNVVYKFTRTGPTTTELTVNFTVGGTATLDNDYSPSGAGSFTETAGSITFGVGQATKTLTLDPIGDTTLEASETIELGLVAGSGYTVGTLTPVTSTIANDETEVSITVSPDSVTEDGTPNLTFTFTRIGVSNRSLTVNFTVGGTATFSSDYAQTGAAAFNATGGRIRFSSGQTTKTITINPKADTTVEPNETVILTVTPASNYSAGTANSALGTILNDDGSLSLLNLMDELP